MVASRFALAIGLFCALCLALSASGQPLFNGAEPRPADAVVLFDGKDLSAWASAHSGEAAGWKVENGYMEVRPGSGDIATKEKFKDFQLHVEFWLPLMADAHGQARANSGVYMQGRYEIQVLDSYGLKSEMGDCGAIYDVSAPLVNASRPPKVWQTYDVVFHGPRFDEKGNETEPARMTVFQNGVLIQDNVAVPGPTTASVHGGERGSGPILLQDHGCRVRYRNVWIRALGA